jgi:thiamine monophosphate synthase
VGARRRNRGAARRGGLRSACDAGVDWIQLRDRSRDGAVLLAAADCAVAAARASARAAAWS